jgi:hypothetical protein
VRSQGFAINVRTSINSLEELDHSLQGNGHAVCVLIVSDVEGFPSALTSQARNGKRIVDVAITRDVSPLELKSDNSSPGVGSPDSGRAQI